MTNKISEQSSFTNREVVSIVVFMAMFVFECSWAYFTIKQQEIIHRDDIEALEKEIEVLDNRLDKYIKRFYESKDN